MNYSMNYCVITIVLHHNFFVLLLTQRKKTQLGKFYVEDYDVDVRNIRNGVVDIRNNVVVKCCK